MILMGLNISPDLQLSPRRHNTNNLKIKVLMSNPTHQISSKWQAYPRIKISRAWWWTLDSNNKQCKDRAVWEDNIKTMLKWCQAALCLSKLAFLPQDILFRDNSHMVQGLTLEDHKLQWLAASNKWLGHQFLTHLGSKTIAQEFRVKLCLPQLQPHLHI